jgi:hypothetical protein
LAYTGAHPVAAFSSMSAPQPGEPEQSASKPGSRWKKILWTVLIAATLIFAGSYVGVVAYVWYGGQDVKDFCSQELVGRSLTEVKELAARRGLETVEQEGWIRATTNPRMSRHTCHMRLDAGKVKSAMAYFRF